MYIIIAGCRKVGSTLAMELSLENHDVAVIDSDSRNFNALGSGFNGVTVTGTPIDEDILRSAGIEKAHALAAVTDMDNINIMVSQIARELFHVPVVITRMHDPQRGAVMNDMGLTTLCTTTMAVDQIKRMLLSASKPETLHIHGTDLVFYTMKPSRGQIGKQTALLNNGVLMGVLRKGRFLLLLDKNTIEPDDLLVAAQYDSKGV